jgi:hypothetical protein
MGKNKRYCPYTGITHPKDAKSIPMMYKASLGIDSSLGI